MSPIHNLKEFDRTGADVVRDERVLREDRWVRAINRGDEKAYEEMYKFYYPRLGQFLLRYLPSKKEAEDVIHNLFFRVWKNRAKLKPQGTLRAYLYTAARNQALKHLGRNKDHRHSDLADYPHLQGEERYPEEKIEYKEFAAAFRNAVKQLPERRRHIFLLHREDHLTYREIADVLDISVKTVETQMSRSIKFLSEKLAHFRE